MPDRPAVSPAAVRGNAQRVAALRREADRLEAESARLRWDAWFSRTSTPRLVWYLGYQSEVVAWAEDPLIRQPSWVRTNRSLPTTPFRLADGVMVRCDTARGRIEVHSGSTNALLTELRDRGIPIEHLRIDRDLDRQIANHQLELRVLSSVRDKLTQVRSEAEAAKED